MANALSKLLAFTDLLNFSHFDGARDTRAVDARCSLNRCVSFVGGPKQRSTEEGVR